MYTYMCPLFFRFLFHVGHHGALVELPVLFSGFSLAVCFIYAAAAAKLLQLCPTLCDHMDCTSSVHGIFQTTVLEWGAIAFSNFTHTSVYMGFSGGASG